MAWQVEYRDGNFPEKAGWQEIVVQAGPDVTLLASSAPTEELSQVLTEYPANVLAPETDNASFRFELVGLTEPVRNSITVPAIRTETGQSVLAKGNSEFASLINRTMDSPWGIFLVLVAAFGWGAAHALTPGHGKTIVAAYLVVGLWTT